MTSPVLLSLRPRYADLVFQGLKRAELRRRFSQCAQNREVFIYVTSPVRVLRGGFRVDHVWKGAPDEIWDEVSAFAGIERPDFDAYYSGSTVAYALSIADVWEFEHPIGLLTLRSQLEKFTVPQSWRYVKQAEIDLYQQLRDDSRAVKRQIG